MQLAFSTWEIYSLTKIKRREKKRSIITMKHFTGQARYSYRSHPSFFLHTRFNPLRPKPWWKRKFSLHDYYLFEHSGDKNKGSDSEDRMSWYFNRQILITTSIRNVWRSVTRICIFISGLKGSNMTCPSRFHHNCHNHKAVKDISRTSALTTIVYISGSYYFFF